MNKEIPVPIGTIVDYMALGREARLAFCPLCGGARDCWFVVCSSCFDLYGERAVFAVKAEIARINPVVFWQKFVDKKLLAFSASGNGSPSRVASTKVVLEGKQAKKQEEVMEEDCSPCVSAPTFTDETEMISLSPGMEVCGEIVMGLAFGEAQKRFLCPVCNSQKDFRDWLCASCFGRFGHEGVSLLKEYLAKLNPDFFARSSFSLSKEQKEELVVRCLALLEAKGLNDFVSRRPDGLANTLRTLKGISRKIPFFVLRDVAKEAIEEWQERLSAKEIKKVALEFLAQEKGKVFSAKELAEKLFFDSEESKIEASWEMVLKVAEEVLEERVKCSGEGGDIKISLEELVALDVEKKLGESELALRAFHSFLSAELAVWKEGRASTGKSCAVDFFAKELGVSKSLISGFLGKPLEKGMKKNTAEGICKKLSVSLREALMLGLALIKKTKKG